MSSRYKKCTLQPLHMVSDSHDLLQVLVSFCKVFDGDEGLIGELMTFLPPMKPDADLAFHTGPVSRSP